MADDQAQEGDDGGFPQAGDMPFLGCQLWHLNACTAELFDRPRPYMEGYKRAARALVAHIEESRGQDFLLYPLVFLWRHCLELQMKDLIALHCKLSEHDAVTLLTHNLDKLWVRARRIIIEMDGASVPYCQAVDGVIAQFMRFDPSATAFRYPHAADGSPSLDGLPEHVNVAHLNKVMERVALFLDCALAELSRELDCKLDHEAEMRKVFDWEGEARKVFDWEREAGRAWGG